MSDTHVTVIISARKDALERLCVRVSEMADHLDSEAHDNDHERSKHVDKFHIRIGGDLLSAEECEALRQEAYQLRYFVKQIRG